MSNISMDDYVLDKLEFDYGRAVGAGDYMTFDEWLDSEWGAMSVEEAESNYLNGDRRMYYNN